MDVRKKAYEEKISKSALVFNDYLNDYFGLIILIFILIVFIGSFFFLWYPRLLRSIDLVNNIKIQLDDEKEQLKKYGKTIVKYQEAYMRINDSDKEKINSMIAPKEIYPYIYKMDLLITFSELLSRYDYDLTNISAVEKIQKTSQKVSKKKTIITSKDNTEYSLPEGILPLDVELEIKNIDYSGLKKLLNLLEKKLRIADVKNIKYSPSRKSCTINLITYRFWDDSLWVE